MTQSTGCSSPILLRISFVSMNMEAPDGQFSAHELEEVHQSFTNSVETRTPSLIRAIFVKTPFKAITIQLLCPSKYPQEVVVIQLASNTLDETLLKKLKMVAEKELKSLIGKPQCVTALRSMQKVVENNMLLSCWHEINSLRTNLRLDATKSSDELEKLEVSEKTGAITISLHLEVIESNLPDWVWQTHILLAQQHALKLVGQFVSLEQHAAAYRQAHAAVAASVPSTKDLLDHKEDMKLLKKLTDLGIEGSKEARRQKTRLLQSELKKMPVAAAQTTKGLTAASVAPSLTASVAQLILMVRQFPYSTCAGCDELMWKTSDRPAERLVCGCYWHHSCLRKHLDSPPFVDKRCTCGNTLVHRWWTPEYARNADKRNANRERNEEEISSINDFLGL